MTADIGQIVIDGSQLLLQHTFHLSGGIGSGIGGVCFDQIDDRLCLGQIQLAVKEGAFGVFTPLSRLGSCQIQSFQTGS